MSRERVEKVVGSAALAMLAVAIGMGMIHLARSAGIGGVPTRPALRGMEQVMRANRCTVYSGRDGDVTLYVAENDENGLPCAVAVQKVEGAR